MGNHKKLTPEQIEEIKALKKKIEEEGGVFVFSQIGAMYGVSGVTIRRNIMPNENDLKPRTNNLSAQSNYEKKFIRTYRFKLNTKNETERRIIDKLDSLPNKQRYLKNLLEKDLTDDTTQ